MKLFEIATPDFDNEKFEDDCSYYIEQMGKHVRNRHMYRGMSKGEENVIKPFRERTSTVSMPSDVHKELNEYFNKAFKHPFRNGLFATGGKATASGYGDNNPKIIVPVGKFNWLSSADMHDIYGAYYSIKEEYGEDRAKKEIMSQVKDKHWYNDKDLPGCILRTNEIMLWCPEGYYVFDREKYLPDAIS